MASEAARCIEQALAQSNLKIMEEGVCLLIKAGITLPDSEIVIKILDGFIPDKGKATLSGDLTPSQMSHLMCMTSICQHLSILAQLCLVKERM